MGKHPYRVYEAIAVERGAMHKPARPRGTLGGRVGGIYWDVTWHATIGRDSFWIPPHPFVYSGVSLFAISVLGGFALTWRGAGSLRAAIARKSGLGFAVAALGPLIQIVAAPLGELWHRAYGLDVTVWSPPHLMGISGGMVGIYGLIVALAGGLPAGERRPYCVRRTIDVRGS